MSMNSNITLFCSILALAAFGGTQTLAKDPEKKDETSTARESGPIQLDDRQLRRLQSNPEKFAQSTIEKLYRMNPSGIVTAEDVEKYRLIEIARARVQFITRFLHLDLDGDGFITTAERKTVTRTEPARFRAQHDLLFLEGDSDKDGRISHPELNAYALAKTKKNRTRIRLRTIDPMAFDLNGDQTVDPAEVSNGVRELAAGVLRRKPAPHNRRSRSNCVLPPPPKDAEIVLLSGYEGWGVSTVAVSGPDRATSLAQLIIEPGTKPLYIFATAYDAIVWKVEGATERVAKFVAQPFRGRKGAAVAVTGLTADKVAFAAAGSCVDYFSDKREAKARIGRAQLTSRIGRNVDHLIAQYELGKVSIPSGKAENGRQKNSRGSIEIVAGNKRVILKDGKIVEMGKTRRNRTAGNLLRFSPGGVVQIDPKDTIAPQPVEAYDVLPEQAGLLQLIRQGAMTVTPDGYYLIKEDIPRFPAGLSGGHSVKFLLGKGVKMPGGSPGHSPVYLEETGECVGHSGCPR